MSTGLQLDQNHIKAMNEFGAVASSGNASVFGVTKREMTDMDLNII